MAKKEQHFVPRVYVKAWETSVETTKEPSKKFQGVYVFSDKKSIGEGKNKESILWKPHLYTIKFQQLYMAQRCPGVFKYYVDAVYETMIDNKPASVYGKLGYSIIKTKSSVRKHLLDIASWEFYYKNGEVAKKKAILNKINDIRCYLLEDSFSELFETHWEQIRDTFIEEVHNGSPIAFGQSERCITEKTAKDMLEFFFMMLCRSQTNNLISYIRQFERKDRLQVKYFVSDMWKPYADLASTYFKNAIPIVDKYHYIRQIIYFVMSLSCNKICRNVTHLL